MPSSICIRFSLATLDCSNSTGWCLRPYGDVSGYGVIVGFKGTGYYVALLLTAYYVTALEPRRNPFEPEGTGPAMTTSWEPNPIDVMVLDSIRKKCAPSWMARHHKRLGNCIVISILQLCDIQAFTGIALLISGFISLPTGISAYHWQIITSLAWFSSITHLSGLTVLRSHHSKYRRNTTVRMVLMFVLLALLIVATVPTGYSSWGDSEFQGFPSDEKHKFMSSPAMCYYNPDSGTWDIWGSAATISSVTEAGSFQSMVVSVLFLLNGFFTRTVKMSRGLSQRITTNIRRPVSQYSQKLLMKISSRNGKHDQRGLRQCMWHILIVQPCLAVFVSVRIMADSYSSIFTEVMWVLVAILWGSFKILGATAQLPRDIFDQENDWTFGQIVPVLLLVVPIFATITHLASNRTTSDPSDGCDHDEPGVGPSVARKPYPFATGSSELPEILTGAYTSYARWLWPNLVGLFLSTAYFTYMSFSHKFDLANGMKPSGSLVEAWFTRFGLFWYLIFGLPCMFSNIVAIGLALDAWFESLGKLVTRVKIFLYLFLVVFLTLAYVGLWLWLVFFGFESYLSEDLYLSDKAADRNLLHVITCIFLNLLYYVLYLFVAFSVQIWTRR